MMLLELRVFKAAANLRISFPQRAVVVWNRPNRRPEVQNELRPNGRSRQRVHSRTLPTGPRIRFRRSTSCTGFFCCLDVCSAFPCTAQAPLTRAGFPLNHCEKMWVSTCHRCVNSLHFAGRGGRNLSKLLTSSGHLRVLDLSPARSTTDGAACSNIRSAESQTLCIKGYQRTNTSIRAGTRAAVTRAC